MHSLFDYLALFTEWVLTLYEWIIIIAIIVSWVSPDPSNPIVQFLNRMTHPLWGYLAGRLPSALSPFSAYASLLLIWFLKVFLPGTILSLGSLVNGEVGMDSFLLRVVGFFLLGFAFVLQNFLFFLMFLLLIWFFMTLISPSINNPIIRTLVILVDPFITPIQRRLPRSRIDFSPIIAAGIFFLINQFLVSTLGAYAAQLAHRGSL